MKFYRSRKSYILCSLCIVIIFVFFSHWKTVSILDYSNSISVLHDKQNKRNIKTERNPERNEKCKLGKGQKIADNCANKLKDVVGVAPSDMRNYQPNEDGFFTCLDGKLNITWNSVNDDYCDCSDGTDEPGTDACPNTKFYCAGRAFYLPSSRINDGICDCCDGSDEWKRVTVRGDVLQEHDFNVKYAPCINTC